MAEALEELAAALLDDADEALVELAAAPLEPAEVVDDVDVLVEEALACELADVEEADKEATLAELAAAEDDCPGLVPMQPVRANASAMAASARAKTLYVERVNFSMSSIIANLLVYDSPRPLRRYRETGKA